METNKIFIYGLCAEDGVIRYVGKSYRPNIRKNYQLSSSKRGLVTHKNNWIRKVLNSGGTINIRILEESDENNWIEREKYWIRQFDNLTNISEGGDGHSGKRYKLTLDDVKQWRVNNIPEIDSEKKWREYFKLNNHLNIPKRPDFVFKNNGWVSWGNFFNTKNIKSNKHAISYNDLKKIAHKNKFDNIRNWYVYARTNNLPVNPQLTYKNNGWISWDDFLGSTYTRVKNEIFYSYDECKKILSRYHLNSTTFNEYIKLNKPTGIPKNPSTYFRRRGVWLGWKDFLSL